jgi:hypothetical protein
MSNTIVRSFLLMTLLAGCAHRGAVRVECDGPLRPINRPALLKDAPVSVVPANPSTPTGSGAKNP